MRDVASVTRSQEGRGDREAVDGELDLLLGRAIDSLVKLDILLYLRARPGRVVSAENLARELRRPVEAVSAALVELAEVGLVERFALGSGKHAVYGAPEDQHTEQVLNRLHERYHQGAESRAELIRRIAGGREQTP